MVRTALVLVAVACGACAVQADDVGGGAGGGASAYMSPEEVTEELGVATEALTECEEGCLAFAREGCGGIKDQCKGHERDSRAIARAVVGEGVWSGPCPYALIWSCGGIEGIHVCKSSCGSDP